MIFNEAQRSSIYIYKRSAGLEALHFQFADMFVNVQFVSI